MKGADKMNLKEAFRYQNKLQRLMEEAGNILGRDSNVTKVENTTLRHKVNPDVEDETNGILSYDRKLLKIKPEEFLPVSEKIYEEISIGYSVACNCVQLSYRILCGGE